MMYTKLGDGVDNVHPLYLQHFVIDYVTDYALIITAAHPDQYNEINYVKNNVAVR